MAKDIASLLRGTFSVAAIVCLCFAGAANAAQDQEHYERAITDRSTSPYYVLVTIIDDRRGTTFNGCVAAHFLVGGIFVEIGGDFGQGADDEKKKQRNALMEKARDIASRNTKHEFHFSNSAALENIPIQYTEEELEEARKIVKSIGMGPLMDLRSPDRLSIGKLEWSVALACAIIEQGASARRADISGQIYAAP